MPKLNMTIPHQYTQEEALKRVRSVLIETQNKFRPYIHESSEKWIDNCGRFEFVMGGMHIAGTLEVKSNEIVLNGNIPFALYPFKSKIESTIKEEAIKALS